MTEAQLRLLVEQMPVAVAMFDCNLRYVAVSSRWLSDFRINGPVLGRSHYDVFPKIPERWKEVHCRALTGEVISECEDRIERADRSVLWLRWEVRPWRDADGVIGGIIIYSEDITARKLADQERQLFVSLAQSSRDFIGMCDAQFTPFFVNAAGLRMVGLGSLEEATRTPVKEFFFPEDQAFIMNDFFPRVKREGCGEVEIRFRHFVTRKPLWMQYSVFSLSEVTSGQVTGYATVSRNITEQKKAQEEERRHAAELQAILDTAPIGLSIALDPQGRSIRGNRANEEMFGVPPGADFSMAGPRARPFKIFHEGRELRIDELPMQRALRGEAVSDQIMEVQRADGRTFIVFAKAKPLLDEAGRPRGAVGAFLDITALKKAEDALRAADRRKDEFLAMLAHELRNPLAPIRNALYVFKRSGADTLNTENLLSIMERQVDHLVRLVDDLLEVSRISHGKIELKKERCDLAGIIRHAVETSQPHIQAAGQRLTVELPSSPVTLDADPVRLAQVFANLLNNAAKYTKNGGSIWLKAERSGDEVIVSVRDNGMGISAEMLPRVFDLFTQSSRALGRAQGGLGIGLALARSLVHLHGGQIEARSEGPGRGSEFTVRLPLAAGASQDETIEGETTVASVPASHRVLVVDDDRDVGDSLVMLLQLMGTDVRVAYNGEAALAAVAEFKPHLALVDIGMPSMDGYETARRIRLIPEGKDLVLVALSGWGGDNDRRRAMEAGFDHHFVKPMEFDALESLLASPPVGA